MAAITPGEGVDVYEVMNPCLVVVGRACMIAEYCEPVANGWSICILVNTT